MSIALMWEIRVFCAVVEKRSFVAAARFLGRSPSAITRSIQALEQELGCELLQRSQKLINLTTAGDSYYEFARQMLELQTEAEEELTGIGVAPYGWIRCSAPETLAISFLPEVIARFAAQHPDVRFDVRYTDEMLDPIREKLDFAIRGGFPHSSDLIGFPLWNYSRHLYASPDYIRQHGSPARPDELEEHAMIVHTAPRILKDWHFIAPDHQCRLHVQPRYRFSSGSAVYHAALQGLGIARLGDWLAQSHEQDGTLVRVCTAYNVTSSTGLTPQMHAVYVNRRQARRVRLFLETIRDAAQQFLPHGDLLA
ncbi:LysR family transcriptional regulator [Uliginosibacterium gangwonense]|uniref:LysR family transcriptional regulator n=1 Tax=Uliginosibacterium gangwonense TaxID=392736 RepID=UPI00035C8987|nr:LysR family transcriptional regulator [Uliginosibacterium gangwonense]